MSETPSTPLSDDDIDTGGTTSGVPLAEQDADGVDNGQDADTQDHSGGTDTDSDGTDSDGTDSDSTDGTETAAI